MTVKELKELICNIPTEYQNFEIIIDDEQYNQELKLKKLRIEPASRLILFEGVGYDCQ
jgi:hypothetical protein